MIENEITEVVIGCAIKVHRSLLINFNVLKLTKGSIRVVNNY